MYRQAAGELTIIRGSVSRDPHSEHTHPGPRRWPVWLLAVCGRPRRQQKREKITRMVSRMTSGMQKARVVGKQGERELVVLDNRLLKEAEQGLT